MLLNEYVHYDKVLSGLHNVIDEIANLFTEYQSLPGFHHIYIEGTVKESTLLKFQPQDIQNHSLSDNVRTWMCDNDRLTDVYTTLLEYISYEKNFFRIQITPALVFVLEQFGNFPYQIEFSSSQIGLHELAEWLTNPCHTKIFEAYQTSLSGFKFKCYISNLLARQNIPDVKQSQEAEATKKKILEEIARVSQEMDKKREALFQDDFKADKIETVPKNKITTSEDHLGLDKIFSEVNEHVEHTKNHKDDEVEKTEIKDTPLVEKMNDIIKTRNEAKMDESSAILKKALETGENPFVTSNPNNPYDKSNEDNQNPMDDIEYEQ